MKKSDFKTFDIVTLRNEIKYFYFNKQLIPINKADSVLSLEFYNDNLTRKLSGETIYDIMRVIRWDDVSAVDSLSYFIDKILNDTEHFAEFLTIFERKEFTEVTMDEIAKKFGVPVKQLKIKK